MLHLHTITYSIRYLVVHWLAHLNSKPEISSSNLSQGIFIFSNFFTANMPKPPTIQILFVGKMTRENLFHMTLGLILIKYKTS